MIPPPVPTAPPSALIPLDSPDLCGNERAYLNACIDTNWISFQGPFVSRLESMLQERCQTTHSMAVANGTCALTLALQALGIGPGDEVLVPTLTMSASVVCVSDVGAKPVFVDSLPGHPTLDPEAAARAQSPRTKALIAVHLYGHVCDVARLRSVLQPGISIIEDVAEALGARAHGKPVGGMGMIGCHSFHNKIIASGEGGALTLNDEMLADRLQTLKTPSANNIGAVAYPVLNHRMSNLAAAVAVAQMERLDDLLARRRAVARRYAAAFPNIPGLSGVVSPPHEEAAHWRCQALLGPEYPLNAPELVAALAEKGIEARQVFSPMHRHPLYAPTHGGGHYPHACAFAERAVDLPSSPRLTEEEQNRVIRALENPLA